MKHHYTIRYTLLGILFGLLFPILSTFGELYFQQQSLALGSILQLHQNSPLLLVIDTAPLFLGIIASFAGRRQDRITEINIELQKQINKLNEVVLEQNKFQQNQEIQISQGTSSLQRLTKDLQAAADIGHATVTIRDLDDLLTQVTHLISSRLNFYHVGVFLLDDTKENAVLRASNSSGGSLMLQNNHHLKIGQEGIVGYVTQQKEPRIVGDVGEDSIFFNNPTLPDTKSEMALPLMVGDQLLGALDIQSTEEAAFSDTDVDILKVLTNQVAVAIHNTFLSTTTEAALDSSRRVSNLLKHRVWKEFGDNTNLGYKSSLGSETKTTSSDPWTHEMIQASQENRILRGPNKTLVIPITLRNEVLGVVRLQKESGQIDWLDDEIELMNSIVDQLVFAIESARLFDDTQHRVAREQLVTEITTKFRSTNDPQIMLKTAVQELKKAIKAQ